MSGSPEKLSAAGQAKLHADHVRWYRQIVKDRKPLTWQEGRDLLNAIDALQAENEARRSLVARLVATFRQMDRGMVAGVVGLPESEAPWTVRSDDWNAHGAVVSEARAYLSTHPAPESSR